MLRLDHYAHQSAAREIIACEADAARDIASTGRANPALRAAVELELRRLPAGEPNRSATLRRWRAEARL